MGIWARRRIRLSPPRFLLPVCTPAEGSCQWNLSGSGSVRNAVWPLLAPRYYCIPRRSAVGWTQAGTIMLLRVFLSAIVLFTSAFLSVGDRGPREKEAPMAMVAPSQSEIPLLIPREGITFLIRPSRSDEFEWMYHNPRPFRPDWECTCWCMSPLDHPCGTKPHP